MKNKIKIDESFKFEIGVFVIGVVFLIFGYKLVDHLFNFIGFGFIMYGVLLSFINKMVLLNV